MRKKFRVNGVHFIEICQVCQKNHRFNNVIQPDTMRSKNGGQILQNALRPNPDISWDQLPCRRVKRDPLAPRNPN